MKQIFESDSISFVPVSESLADDYLVMVNDYENVNRYIGGKNKSYTFEQEIAWVRKQLKEKAAVFSMIEKNSGAFIGNIEFMNLTGSEGELGIAITAKMQNKGYGSEAIRAFIEYGMSHMGLKRIVLRVRPDNERAIRVYEKCGFREYSRDDDHIHMEVSKENKAGGGAYAGID